MTRLDRLVLTEVVPPFTACIFLFSGLILASGDLIRFAEYLQSGESALLVGQLLVYTLPSILSLTFPIAMLLATLLGVGRLSADSELTALVAAGASFERILLPVGVFGLLVSFVAIWFTNAVVPAANAGRQAIIDSVAQRRGFTVPQNAFSQSVRLGNTLLEVHTEGGVSFGEGRTGAATLRNLSLEQWEKGRMVLVVYASRADWEVGTRNWRLSGQVYGADFTNPARGVQVLNGASSFATEEFVLGTPSEVQSLKETRVEDVSTKNLRQRSKLFRRNGDVLDARDADVEVARRIALPFASFVFALIGAPLGVRPPRSGNGVGFGVAIGLTFAYWTLLQLAAVVGRGGIVPPWLAVSLPNLLCLGAGLYLIRRRSRGQD